MRRKVVPKSVTLRHEGLVCSPRVKYPASMKLADYLHTNGLTPADLRLMLGQRNGNTIGRYLRGERIPGPYTLQRIITFTKGGVQLEDFLDESPPECATRITLPDGRFRLVFPWTGRDADLEASFEVATEDADGEEDPPLPIRKAMAALGARVKGRPNVTFFLDGGPSDAIRRPICLSELGHWSPAHGGCIRGARGRLLVRGLSGQSRWHSSSPFPYAGQPILLVVSVVSLRRVDLLHRVEQPTQPPVGDRPDGDAGRLTAQLRNQRHQGCVAHRSLYSPRHESPRLHSRHRRRRQATAPGIETGRPWRSPPSAARPSRWDWAAQTDGSATRRCSTLTVHPRAC